MTGDDRGLERNSREDLSQGVEGVITSTSNTVQK